MAKKKDNTLLYAGLGLAAFMLFKKNNNKTELNGISGREFKVIGKVVDIKYRNTSTYGNPSYWVTVETPDGDTIFGYTSPNASLGYSIQNSDYKYHNHVFTCTSAKRGVIFQSARKF